MLGNIDVVKPKSVVVPGSNPGFFVKSISTARVDNVANLVLDVVFTNSTGFEIKQRFFAPTKPYPINLNIREGDVVIQRLETADEALNRQAEDLNKQLLHLFKELGLTPEEYSKGVSGASNWDDAFQKVTKLFEPKHAQIEGKLLLFRKKNSNYLNIAINNFVGNGKNKFPEYFKTGDEEIIISDYVRKRLTEIEFVNDSPSPEGNTIEQLGF